MNSELKDKRLYVVDDTAFMRAGLINQLVELGFERKNIIQFENGKLAFDALLKDEHGVDLVLSDWNMPLMTGIELLKFIRNSEKKNVPVVMITTVSEKDKVIEALKFKLSGYIIKPVDSEKLGEVIESIFPELDL